jgi:voltage-gated potassium channel
MNSSSLQYRIYLVILVFVFLIGMLGLMAIEQFSALDALYFTIATISTVGYGDLHPVTPAGKILAIIIILTGVGCFVGFVANSIEYLIAQRERKLQIRKLNMISGVFFTEVGTNLLKKFSAQDPAIEEIRSALLVSDNWSDAEFSHADEVLKNHIPRLNSRTVDLEELKECLIQQKGFLLSLLENPQLVEHENFIPLLLEVFHMTEELIIRKRLTDLPSADYDHLTEDLNRIYGFLIAEWLIHMKHLKQNYPHLFSLAMRTNPFDADASPMVE